MIHVEDFDKLDEQQLEKAVEQNERYQIRFEDKEEERLNKLHQEWEDISYESSPVGQLTKLHIECENYFKRFQNINKENYKEDIGYIITRGGTLYDKISKLQEETCVEDTYYNLDIDDAYGLISIEEIAEEFFNELDSLEKKVLYEYDFYELILKYDEEITVEQQVVALRKEGFSPTQILTVVDDIYYEDIIKICKEAKLI